ncbi:FadR family transcriptional regulator [Rhodospirillaceae bacterium KN72]|uniref:FadR family transcriptional regulator n=1 Tax=Pacificispira spongiicola TaxID=2729598 RepID=A0A7Y0DY20_9PROT|nr:FadR/GntR family transcriptional regulator [Pacificispira spongiicola]NMM43665.1 FadR family transcriptional regulator [Pacificispira spongiicola]
MTEKSSSQARQGPIADSIASERAFVLADTKSGGSALVHQIGREIVSGTFPAETRLPDEASMLKRYSVSRTTLREAYSKLAAKGMIIARPKVGTSVRQPAFWNMLDPEVLGWHLEIKPPGEIARDLYALRRMVEPTTAALAARQCSEDDIRKIEEAFADMCQTSRNEIELVEADLRFHLEILYASRNHFIGAFSALIHAAMMSTFKLSWRGAEAAVIKTERLRQHGEVVEAIKQRAPDLARKRMETLLDDSINDVVEALADR